MKQDNFENTLSNAATSLRNFATGEGQQAADLLAQSFERAGHKIANSLALAAKSGQISIKGLAQSILRDLSNIGFEKFVSKPLDGFVNAIMSNITQFGARASGGPVNQGGAYLVGENGPELFVPRTGGVIENQFGGAPINIHINMNNNSQLSDVKRSAGQISAALARAVQKGRNRL